MLIALHSGIDGRQPKNTFEWSDKIVRFTMDFPSTKPTDDTKLHSFQRTS